MDYTGTGAARLFLESSFNIFFGDGNIGELAYFGVIAASEIRVIFNSDEWHWFTSIL